jgi:hypothetical protein
VLAAAHLGHDPTNNRPRNLKALCQRCHMLYDRESTGGGACSRYECGTRSETRFWVFIGRRCLIISR